MKNVNVKRLLKIFFIFFRIGAFTIGGGYAMLPLMEREVVDNRKWVSQEEIVDVFAIVQSVPGVIAINSSIFIGYKIAGIPGAITAALGVITPPFIIIIFIAQILFSFNENTYVQKAFSGIRAGVTALIGLSAFKLAKSVIKDKIGLCIALASFTAIVVFKIHAIISILASGFAGFVIYGLFKYKKSNNT